MEPESTVTEVAEVTEVAREEAEEEPPPTPSPKPRKKAVRISQPPAPNLQPPVHTLDAEFWASMITTKREMDSEATRTRYSNLVVFK